MGKEGRRNEEERGRVNTARHPRSLEKRKDCFKAGASEQKRKGEGGREGRGNKCKNIGGGKKGRKGCTRAASVIVRRGTKNIVFVNGSW